MPDGIDDNQHLQYAILIQWSPQDKLYQAILPEWQEWLKQEAENYNPMPTDLIPVIIGHTYEEAVCKALDGLLGPPEKFTTLRG